jgi:hypothetical protein
MPKFRREGRAGLMQRRKLLEYPVFEQVCEFPEISGNVLGYGAHDSSNGERAAHLKKRQPQQNRCE